MKRIVLSIVVCVVAMLVILVALYNFIWGIESKMNVAGSTIVTPILKKCAEVYKEKKSKKINFEFHGGGTVMGFEALIDGKTDIAGASREIHSDEMNQARDNGVDPVKTLIAKDGLAVIVNKTVDIEKLYLYQIKKIYLGEIDNWKELGGPDKKIIVMSRHKHSGSYETFSNKVMQWEELGTDSIIGATNADLLNKIIEVPYSIGYVGLGYIDDRVNVLTIEGVYPTVEAVSDGSYLISRSLYIYTDGQPKKDVKDFVDFILSPDGQYVVSEIGYIPLH